MDLRIETRETLGEFNGRCHKNNEKLLQRREDHRAIVQNFGFHFIERGSCELGRPKAHRRRFVLFN